MGGAMLLRRPASPERPRLESRGVVAVSGGMFCMVYGFANAATHNWHTPSTWGFLAAGVALLAVFAWWQTRAPAPLLPLRVVLDRNRGAAYLSILIAGSGIFGIFLFLTYYLQLTLRFSPVVTGVAFLPMVGCIMASANLANIVLMPRFGPKPLVAAGMLLAAGGLVWLTRIGVHSSYAADVLPPLLIIGTGLGQAIAPSINAGTFGVAPSDAGVASASVNTRQQLGGARRQARGISAGGGAAGLAVWPAARLAAGGVRRLVRSPRAHGRRPSAGVARRRYPPARISGSSPPRWRTGPHPRAAVAARRAVRPGRV